jgi:hypothetical protein
MSTATATIRSVKARAVVAPIARPVLSRCVPE